MKRLLLSIIIAVFAIVSPADETKQGDMVALVGIAKIIAHPALDAIEKGIQDQLKEMGFEKIIYDIQSANGEISTATSIANKFRSERVNVAVGIATPMALALANNLDNIPIVFSAVTDPVSAGLRTKLAGENTNITGVSDKTPVREQIILMQKLTNAKKVGFIYNPGESNSIVTLKELQEVCKDLKLQLITTTVTNTSEVIQATKSVISQGAEAIYVSTDNVVAAAITSVTTTAMNEKIPVIGADPVTAKDSGALAAYGVDYYTAGKETGKIVAQILLGKKPADIPVKFMTQQNELKLYIDKDVAKKLNITIPKDLMQ